MSEEGRLSLKAATSSERGGSTGDTRRVKLFDYFIYTKKIRFWNKKYQRKNSQFYIKIESLKFTPSI